MYILIILILPDPVDFQTSAIEIEPNSDNLFVVNLRTTDGQVTVINPSTFSIVNQITCWIRTNEY